jgi:tetratricopeptide (TPR) repeat protein
MSTEEESLHVDKKPCVQCRKMIHQDARMCPFCRSSQFRNYWLLLANYLKWIGASTAVISLLIGVLQVNKIFTNWQEKRDAISQIIKASKMRHEIGDLDGAWSSINEALDIDPTNRKAQLIQIELAVARLHGFFICSDNNKLTKELFRILSRGAASSNKIESADAMAHLAYLDWICGAGTGYIPPVIKLKVEKQLTKALKVDKNNVYANTILGWVQFYIDMVEKKEKKVAEAMHYFTIALKTNRDRKFVRRFQFSVLFWIERYEEVIKLANELRINGEKLYYGTYSRILERFKKLWTSPNDKVILASLTPKDLLNTYLWLESNVDFTETRWPYRFVKIRLIENTGDAKRAVELYKNLIEYIEKDKSLSKNAKSERKEIIRKRIEKLLSKL